MLAANAIMYLVFAWLTGQLISSNSDEGRPLASVLILLWSSDGDTVVVGDVRGMEREKSKSEGSVHAYKVSKTYSGVQALKVSGKPSMVP